MPTVHVDRLETLAALLGEAPVALVYFGAPTCGVCVAVKPKIEALVERSFPRALLIEVDRDLAPDVAAAWSVFSLPTVVVAAGGQESRRFVRAFAVDAVAEALARPYAMAFDA